MRFLIGLLFAATLTASQTSVLGPSGEITFHLEDRLAHPFIWWPRTLLEYPVKFGVRVAPGGLSLVDEKGDSVPFQLSRVELERGLLKSATVCFFSDLPSGGSRAFILKTAPVAPAAPQVVETIDAAGIVLDAGVGKVRIPASQSNPAEAPGPVMQLGRQGRWIGRSGVFADGARVARITSTRIESGPLFVTYRVAYEFAPSGRYTATVRVLGGTEFVELFEEMEGLKGARMETHWSGFEPQYRQAPNHPYDPGHEIPDPAEPIDFDQTNTHIGVSPGIGASGELPFRLGIFEPWPAFRIGTWANFWNAKTGDALGVFIDKVERWRDGGYGIWSPSDKLEVRYFWKNGDFFWTWPLADGTRSTCLTFYDHALDRKAVENMAKSHAGVRGPDGIRYVSALQPTSHALFLQNRHGLLDLNRVKDWVLEYPPAAAHPAPVFPEGRIRTAGELERAVMESVLLCECATSGTRQNGGFGPVPSRQIAGWWVDGFNRLYPQMTPAQRSRLTAAFLLMGYTHAGEDYMPMIPILSGHPNFLSDVKSVPAMMAFLFPEHPMAKTWADLFRRFMELNTHYHTRPDVGAWDALGGRWTENLGTYVWAFARPAMRANYTLMLHDGGNRLPTPGMVKLGDYLVNALSAPFAGEPPEFLRSGINGHNWGLVTAENGPRRVHPPQGAHAARRMPPRSMWMMGHLLERYSPLTAESLMWAARPGDQDMEQPLTGPDPWRVMYEVPDNRGTDPHLASAKYTGYGVVLRAGVGTPRELSIHLQQIDPGPNYRWGDRQESGGGAIYFFAQGKSYSHNGEEDTGDRATQDTDLQTNFGVWKDGKFRSIGRQVLDRPLYDLGIAQFAELDSDSYSAPEYVGRSVLLIGEDYFATLDKVYNASVAHRFSWFTGRWEDLPFIHLVNRGRSNQPDVVTEITTSSTKGVWYDGKGDALAIVSHRRDLQVDSLPFGARVRIDGGEDLVFRDEGGVRFNDSGTVFEGRAGVIRRRPGSDVRIALIHGARIAAGGLEIATPDPELGISATVHSPAEASGVYHAPKASRVRFAPLSAAVYIDGERQNATDGALILKAGTHRWQITSGDATPLAPRILRTESTSGGARIFVEPVPGASDVRLELSRDNGATWTPSGESLQGMPDGKIHVRAVARIGSREGPPGAEYPVYIGHRPPLPPDGLSVELRDGAAVLSWGEVLGVTEYRLYADGILVYHGLDHGFRHAPAASEYSVSAVSDLGEGPRSNTIDARPGSWLTFDPKPGEPFVRRASDGVIPFADESSPPRYYPR